MLEGLEPPEDQSQTPHCALGFIGPCDPRLFNNSTNCSSISDEDEAVQFFHRNSKNECNLYFPPMNKNLVDCVRGRKRQRGPGNLGDPLLNERNRFKLPNKMSIPTYEVCLIKTLNAPQLMGHCSVLKSKYGTMPVPCIDHKYVI